LRGEHSDGRVFSDNLHRDSRKRLWNARAPKGGVAGADVAGASYDGSYTENDLTGQLDFDITMNAPAGITPVQTGIPLASPISLPIKASLLRDDIGTEKPTLAHTPLGPVNVLFKKIRDFP
jgi:hypothetical protein